MSLFLILLVSATQAMTCNEASQSGSSNQEYQDLIQSEKDPKKLAAKVHQMLNYAFFPMTRALHDAVKATTPKEIKTLLGSLGENSPIYHSQFVSGFAQFNDPSIQQLAEYNGASARRYYNVDKSSVVGLHSNFIYIMPEAEKIGKFGITEKMFGSVITPIGAYGEKFALALLRTTQIMNGIAEGHMEQLARKTLGQNEKLLAGEAARTMVSSLESSILELTPLSALREGVVSFHQFVNLVLHIEVLGEKSGQEALRQLIFEGNSPLGLTSEFTANVPMAMTGPMTLTGYHFTKPFVRTPDGRLALSTELKDFLKEKMEAQVRSGRRRGVCPMASFFLGKKANPELDEAKSTASEKVAGLQLIAKAYWHVFNVVHSQLK